MATRGGNGSYFCRSRREGTWEAMGLLSFEAILYVTLLTFNEKVHIVFHLICNTTYIQ